MVLVRTVSTNRSKLMVQASDNPAIRPGYAEYCVYGMAYGTFGYFCARSPEEAMSYSGRAKDGGTRVIELVEAELSHAHNGTGSCVPRVVLYRSSKEKTKAMNRINRAIVAGNKPVHF